MDEALEIFCKMAKRRLRQDYDLVAAITGGEGIGKSTLAIRLGMLIDPKFDLENNIIYIPNYEQIVKKVTVGLPRFSVVLVDEAVKVMYKRRWQFKPQIFLNQIYAICRKENKATLLCMPNFSDFDKFFRQHRIMIWIHILKRGKAVMFMRDWSPFAKDVWWVEANQKLIEKYMRKRKIIDQRFEDKIRVMRKSRNFMGEFNYDPLPKEMEDKYRELNAGYRLEMPTLTPDSAMKEKYRRALGDACVLLCNRFGLTQTEVGKAIDMSQRTVSRLLEERQKRPIDIALKR